MSLRLVNKNVVYLLRQQTAKIGNLDKCVQRAYIEHCSFMFDIKIIIMTVVKALKRSDIMVGEQYGEGHGRLDKVRGYVPRREIHTENTTVQR